MLSDPQATLVAVYKGHTDTVAALAAAPGGGQFASAGWDGAVHIWRTGAGTALTVRIWHGGVWRAASNSWMEALLACWRAAHLAHSRNGCMQFLHAGHACRYIL